MNSLLLGTTIENYVQEEDSKLGQLIYLLQRVILEKKLRNEQVSSGNTREIHENSKNYFDWILELIGQNKQMKQF